MGNTSDRYWEFAHLLSTGATISQARKKLIIPRTTAYRWASRAVDDNLLIPSSIWPRTYSPAPPNGTQVKPRGDIMGNLPLLSPHRYGGSFFVLGRLPALKTDKTGRYWAKPSTHTLQLGRSKAIIWLKVFRGTTTTEQEDNAFTDLLAWAGHYAQEFGIRLTLDRVFNGVEWVANEELSAKASQMLGMKKYEQREIADITLKNGDKSHDGLEFNQAPGHPAHIPTQHAHTLEYLLIQGPRLLERIVKAAEALDRRIEALEKQKEAQL